MGSPPNEFALAASAFVELPTEGWLLVFSEPLDLTRSTFDLADWAVFAQSGWTAPTAITGAADPRTRILQSEDYSDGDTRVRYTGPFDKVFALSGASLRPFDVPTG